MYKRDSKGFSLVELVIVILVIGFVATVISRAIGPGIISSSRGQAMKSVGEKMINNWVSLTQIANLPTDPDDIKDIIPEISSNDDVLGILVLGRQYSDFPSNNGFLRAYEQTGIEPMTKTVTVEASSQYLVEEYPINISFDTNDNIIVTYEDVEREMVRKILVEKYGEDGDPDDSGTLGKTEGDLIGDCSGDYCDLSFYRYWIQ